MLRARNLMVFVEGAGYDFITYGGQSLVTKEAFSEIADQGFKRFREKYPEARGRFEVRVTNNMVGHTFIVNF